MRALWWTGAVVGAVEMGGGWSRLLLLSVLSGCATLPSTQTEKVDNRRVEYALIRHQQPVVVFENGLGATMGKSWLQVFSEIGKDTTVFAYNRPGYGESSPVSTPRDAAHIVEELRALLRIEGLQPPYVLVGHSVGGLYMQLFARHHPDEILGLVLVDSTHPTQFEGAGSLEQQPLWIRSLFAVAITGMAKEEFSALEQTGQQILQAPTVTGKPVIVLSAADKSDSKTAQFANAKRADLARLYPGCRQTWVDSGHFIQIEKPEVVIEAIREVVTASAGSGAASRRSVARSAAVSDWLGEAQLVAVGVDDMEVALAPGRVPRCALWRESLGEGLPVERVDVVHVEDDPAPP
jgi:pimeloyl-ACP methyl ester carboxylesterase